MLEVEGGRVRRYPGNYTAYARQKQMVRRVHDSRIPRDKVGDKSFFKAKAKSMMRRAKAIGSRLERIYAEKPHEASGLRLRLDEGVGAGPNLALATDLGFSYDGRHWLFRKTGFFLQRGDRGLL